MGCGGSKPGQSRNNASEFKGNKRLKSPSLSEEDPFADEFNVTTVITEEVRDDYPLSPGHDNGNVQVRASTGSAKRRVGDRRPVSGPLHAPRQRSNSQENFFRMLEDKINSANRKRKENDRKNKKNTHPHETSVYKEAYRDGREWNKSKHHSGGHDTKQVSVEISDWRERDLQKDKKNGRGHVRYSESKEKIGKKDYVDYQNGHGRSLKDSKDQGNFRPEREKRRERPRYDFSTNGHNRKSYDSDSNSDSRGYKERNSNRWNEYDARGERWLAKEGNDHRHRRQGSRHSYKRPEETRRSETSDGRNGKHRQHRRENSTRRKSEYEENNRRKERRNSDQRTRPTKGTYDSNYDRYRHSNGRHYESNNRHRI